MCFGTTRAVALDISKAFESACCKEVQFRFSD